MIRHNLEAFYILWNNGERLLIISVVAVLTAVLIVAGILLAITIFPRSIAPFTPLVRAPITLSSSTVQPGDELTITGRVCNNSDDYLYVQMITRIISLDDPLLALPGPIKVFEIAGHTCDLGVDKIIIAAGAPAGLWRFTGNLVAHDHRPDAQLLPFESLPFQITRPEGCCGSDN